MATGNIIFAKKQRTVRRAISVSFDEETFLWINKLAARDDTSFAATARRLIEDARTICGGDL